MVLPSGRASSIQQHLDLRFFHPDNNASQMAQTVVTTCAAAAYFKCHPDNVLVSSRPPSVVDPSGALGNARRTRQTGGGRCGVGCFGDQRVGTGRVLLLSAGLTLPTLTVRSLSGTLRLLLRELLAASNRTEPKSRASSSQTAPSRDANACPRSPPSSLARLRATVAKRCTLPRLCSATSTRSSSHSAPSSCRAVSGPDALLLERLRAGDAALLPSGDTRPVSIAGATGTCGERSSEEAAAGTLRRIGLGSVAALVGDAALVLSGIKRPFSIDRPHGTVGGRSIEGAAKPKEARE